MHNTTYNKTSKRVSHDDAERSNQRRGKRLTFSRLITVTAAFLVILAGVAFAMQQRHHPEIDPNLSVPVALQPAEQPADPLEGISEGAITRSITQEIIDSADHPLIPLLEVARKGIQFLEENVQDYRCTIISQARVDGVLGDERYMCCKVRHEQKVGDKTCLPFSIYTCFLKPEKVAGQEAIWVEGKNKGKIVAHGPGILNIKTLHLNPDGALAMTGNRYSMPNLGMKNLILKLIEKGTNDLNYGECTATVKRGVKLDGHTCTMMEIVHPQPRDYFEFHIARIYIDDERNLPIAYEGYVWPENPGDPPVLLEKYYYTDIEINQGFKNLDFSPRNREYDFPRW
jgi:hypothetical protein